MWSIQFQFEFSLSFIVIWGGWSWFLYLIFYQIGIFVESRGLLSKPLCFQNKMKTRIQEQIQNQIKIIKVNRNFVLFLEGFLFFLFPLLLLLRLFFRPTRILCLLFFLQLTIVNRYFSLLPDLIFLNFPFGEVHFSSYN